MDIDLDLLHSLQYPVRESQTSTYVQDQMQVLFNYYFIFGRVVWHVQHDRSLLGPLPNQKQCQTRVRPCSDSLQHLILTTASPRLLVAWGWHLLPQQEQWQPLQPGTPLSEDKGGGAICRCRHPNSPHWGFTTVAYNLLHEHLHRVQPHH